MDDLARRQGTKAEFSRMMPIVYRTFVRLFLASLIACTWSCGGKRVDLRALAPADSLVFLETRDLGAVLEAVASSRAFSETARSRPDVSALKGVQLALTLTGFESKDMAAGEASPVGSIQPRFVAIVDPNLWQWQVDTFADEKLGTFVADVFGDEVRQERSERHGGTFYEWATEDGRRAFALVIDGVIYFTNDENGIDRCLAVKHGEAEAIGKGGKLPPIDSHLASGYIAPDGVAQIASIAGLRFAQQSSDEGEVQSAIARTIPQLARGVARDIIWTAQRSAEGIEDRYVVAFDEDVASVLDRTMTAADSPSMELLDFIPKDQPVTTFYNFTSPQIAWRSLLLTAQAKVDPPIAAVLPDLANALTEPYGVKDPELFLSGVGPSVATANLDENGDKPLVVASISIAENVRRSLLDELKPDKALGVEYKAEILRSEEGSAAAIVDGIVIAGHVDAVAAALKTRAAGIGIRHSFPRVNGAASVTRGRERATAALVASVLSEKRSPDASVFTLYTTETRFTRTAIERRTISDFGLIGWIIAQLGE